MRFPTMWYVWPAKAQTSLRICAVWSKPLLVTWMFYETWATEWTPFEKLSLKGGYTGLPESTHVKMPYYWKSHVAAHILILNMSKYIVIMTIRKLYVHWLPSWKIKWAGLQQKFQFGLMQNGRLGSTCTDAQSDHSLWWALYRQWRVQCFFRRKIKTKFLFVQVTNFSVMLEHFLGWTSTKQRIKCLAQRQHSASCVAQPANPQSLCGCNHWTTLLLLVAREDSFSLSVQVIILIDS